MINITKKYYTLEFIFSTLWLIYFMYSLVLTIYDTTVNKITWKQAKNISSSYGCYKVPIVTYGFQKENIHIAREYGYFTQGLTVWAWDINKKAQHINISFFVKKKDYEKVTNNTPTYHKLWFSDINDVDTISFFGLRKLGEKPNKILLFFDLWKYNYSIIIGFCIFFMLTLIMVILKKY